MERNTNAPCVSVPKRALTVAAALSFAALAALSGAAAAQKADRPVVKAGDQWQFSKSSDLRAPARKFTWVVTSVTPEGIQATEDGQPLALTPDLQVLDSPFNKASNPKLLTFPLEVGKSWTFVNDYALKDTGTSGQTKHSVVVLTYEKVRVAAGEFDAFKLESTGTFSGRARTGEPISGITVRTYWYAPAARAVVKEEIKDPYRGAYGFELIALKLQP
jgi:hypothetical protein